MFTLFFSFKKALNEVQIFFKNPEYFKEHSECLLCIKINALSVNEVAVEIIFN